MVCKRVLLFLLLLLLLLLLVCWMHMMLKPRHLYEPATVIRPPCTSYLFKHGSDCVQHINTHTHTERERSSHGCVRLVCTDRVLWIEQEQEELYMGARMFLRHCGWIHRHTTTAYGPQRVAQPWRFSNPPTAYSPAEELHHHLFLSHTYMHSVRTFI